MTSTAVISTLQKHMSARRFSRIREVAAQRMAGLTVVMENLYDHGNRSAVYRTAEGHGLCDVHVIRPEAAQKAHARDVSRGSEKWLNIHRHSTTEQGMKALQSHGFSVIAADLESARPLSSFTFDQPMALVFGNEHAGITDTMRAQADGCFLLPMRGFIQSYNISVAAAISLGYARQQRERAIGRRTDMSPPQSEALLASYMRRSVTHADRILERSEISWNDPFRR